MQAFKFLSGSRLLSIFLPVLFMSAFMPAPRQPEFFEIPQQFLNLYGLIGEKQEKLTKMQAFQVSGLISLGEYKRYLQAVKKDSSLKFYISQLPDSSIGPPDTWEKYVCTPACDKYPALGISWDNAMNYCRWKTLADNKGEIRFVYRLPFCSEWLAAFHYLDKKKLKHDLNGNYSDWTMSTYDESAYDFSKEDKSGFSYDYFYFHVKKDAKVLKRKRVVGNSYLYQQDTLMKHRFSFYADEGYRQVAFRCVKDSVDVAFPGSVSHSVLKYWGLVKK